MESLSHAALLISFLAFADVAFGQESQQLSYLLSGRRGFGDESGLEVGPRRYVFEGGNALSAASDVSFPYGTARLAIVPGGFEREYGGRVEDVENLGNSDTIPYGWPKLSGRKTIVILIRRRRPWSQGGSGLEDGGGRWGRPDYDYPSDDQTASERRRARRALLRIVLSKLLLAAARRSLARDGSDEDEGRGSRSEQPWGRSERGWISGWRFGEGSDFGSADSYDGRSSRWTRGGLGGEGGRVLLRIMRPNKGESGGIILLGSGRGPQSGARWSPSENIEGTSGSIPAVSSEESAPISDTASSNTGYGIVRNMGSIILGAQGHPFAALPSLLRGRLAGSRGFGGSSESVTAQPSTWLGSNSFQQLPNSAGHDNEDISYGGMGRNYYPVYGPRLFYRFPQYITPSGQASSPSGNFDGSFGGSPVTALSTPINSRYNSALEEMPGVNPMNPSELNVPSSVSNAADGSSNIANAPLSQKS
ncbi:uncharacterized protein LOC119170986 [Rhipicephalus microplus]|uniref:uncharacterized protein LOC119170986 n=1 Tax=Rhipicephalus microplus TaxID=6941 RepID=UPI003F6BB9A1